MLVYCELYDIYAHAKYTNTYPLGNAKKIKIDFCIGLLLVKSALLIFGVSIFMHTYRHLYLHMPHTCNVIYIPILQYAAFWPDLILSYYNYLSL